MPLDLGLGSQTIEASKQPDALCEQSPLVSSADIAAQEELDRRLRFSCALEALDSEEDRWLQRVERHFASLLEPKQSLLAELAALARQAGQEFLGEDRIDGLLSYSKKKDYLLRRAELLDRDDELSAAALEAKNVIGRLL